MDKKYFEDYQYSKNWRKFLFIGKIFMILVGIFFAIITFFSDWTTFSIVMIFELIVWILMIFAMLPYHEQYRIDENGIAIITKKGKIRKHMRWDELGVQIRATVYAYRGPDLDCLFFIRKGHEDILIADRRERHKWLRSKHTVYLMYSQEISDFVYEKTGITLLNIKE